MPYAGFHCKGYTQLMLKGCNCNWSLQAFTAYIFRFGRVSDVPDYTESYSSTRGADESWLYKDNKIRDWIEQNVFTLHIPP
jgi:hypothetical protein